MPLERAPDLVLAQLKSNGCVKIYDSQELHRFLCLLKREWATDAYNRGREQQKQILRRQVLDLIGMPEREIEIVPEEELA
jgi:hypothetical protein